MNDKLKNLWRYIFPAMGGLFVTYLYNVVDGIFVGQGVGAAALGAVNIGVPLITFSVAVAAMFPMGGATVVAIRMGRGDKEGANHAFMTSVALTLLVSLLLTMAGMVFCDQIIDMSGGRTLGKAMRDMAADYLFYYCAFSIPMLMSTCLSAFVRNDGSPTLSFAGMCVGAGANIFLDWLFIFPLDMGVIGAAIASGLGQVFSVAVLLSHFVRRQGSLRFRRFHLSGALAMKICKRGCSGGRFPTDNASYRSLLQPHAGKAGGRHWGVYIQCSEFYLLTGKRHFVGSGAGFTAPLGELLRRAGYRWDERVFPLGNPHQCHTIRSHLRTAAFLHRTSDSHF